MLLLHEQLLFILGTKLPRGRVLRHPFATSPSLFAFF
jgi:hypothetical protein